MRTGSISRADGMDTESGSTTKYTRDKVKTPLYFILE